MGGTKELIADKETGLIITPDEGSIKEALMILIKNRKRRIKLATNLRKLIEREFNWKSIAEQFRKILSDLYYYKKIVKFA